MTPPSNPDKPTLESAKRSIEVDMSPAAIDRRMREMAELWEVWRFLRRFRPTEAPKPVEVGNETAKLTSEH